MVAKEYEEYGKGRHRREKKGNETNQREWIVLNWGEKSYKSRNSKGEIAVV